jgi:hypothetical protein
LALSEFQAMETAYLALHELDPTARTRALHWLTDALAGARALPQVDARDRLDSVQRAASAAVPAGKRVRIRTATTSAKPKTAAAPAPKGTRARTAKRTTASEMPSGERAYRRMPPADEVMAAYGQVGTVRGLADFFGVPRHTVQGWARRLRGEGYRIGQGA